MSDTGVPGYTYGEETVPEPPITMEEFDRLKQSVMWSDDDDDALETAGTILEPQIEDVLDVWYGFVGDHDFLLHYFTDADTNEPIEEYLDRVRERFGQWIRDTCNTPYDEEWLAYQFEIGRRHHHVGKNEADDVTSVPHIHFRYVNAFIYPITATIRDFLAGSDRSQAVIDDMYHAWFKSVVLQVTLWSYPYIPDDDW